MATDHSIAAELHVAQHFQIVFHTSKDGNLEVARVGQFSWITAQHDGTEHAVSDEAQAGARRGVYQGLCGGRFLAASMDVGPGERCASCRAFLRVRAARRAA